MAEATERRGEIASELPTRYLPGVEYRDLPEPVPLRKLIGASVIVLATALGSGELIVWPYITTQAGIGLLWLAFVGFTAQYFLNMEIERYTLATGETAVTGFTRMWIGWGPIFILGSILPNAFPAWASSAAKMFTFLFSLSDSTVPIITTIVLVSIALAVTVSPVIYNTIERVEMVLVAVILVFLLVAIAFFTDGSSWAGIVTQAPQGAADLPATASELGALTILGALAFAGAGGCNNLVQSNYIRDKGMGMGQRIPNIVSPITGEEQAAPSLGYMMRTDEENMRRWRGWWSVSNKEQILTFYIIGLLTLIGLSVLVHSTLGVGNFGEDLEFLRAEGEYFGENIGVWFEYFFYASGFAILLSTNVGVVDWVSRLTGDSLKVTFLKDSTFWSESKLYITTVWLLCILGIGIIWTGAEPIFLIIMASAGGGFMMFFYSGLLILLNRRLLPEQIKLRSWRLVGMTVAFLIYTIFVGYVFFQVFTEGITSLA